MQYINNENGKNYMKIQRRDSWRRLFFTYIPLVLFFVIMITAALTLVFSLFAPTPYKLLVIPVAFFVASGYYEHLAHRYFNYMKIYSLAAGNTSDRKFLYNKEVKDDNERWLRTQPIHDENYLSFYTSYILNDFHPQRYYKEYIKIENTEELDDDYKIQERGENPYPLISLGGGVTLNHMPKTELSLWRLSKRTARHQLRNSLTSLIAVMAFMLTTLIFLDFRSISLIDEKLFFWANLLIAFSVTFGGSHWISRKSTNLQPYTYLGRKQQ